MTTQSRERERKSRVDLHVTPNLSQFNKTRSNLTRWLLFPNLIGCNWAITCERIVDERGEGFVRGFCPPVAIRWRGEMIRLLLHPSRHLLQSHYMLLTVPTPNAQAAIHPGIPFLFNSHHHISFRSSPIHCTATITPPHHHPPPHPPSRPISYRQFTSQTIRTSLSVRSPAPIQAGRCTLEDLVEEWATLPQSKQATIDAATTKTLTPLRSHYCWARNHKLKRCFTHMGKS